MCNDCYVGLKLSHARVGPLPHSSRARSLGLRPSATAIGAAGARAGQLARTVALARAPAELRTNIYFVYCIRIVCVARCRQPYRTYSDSLHILHEFYTRSSTLTQRLVLPCQLVQIARQSPPDCRRHSFLNSGIRRCLVWAWGTSIIGSLEAIGSIGNGCSQPGHMLISGWRVRMIRSQVLPTGLPT
eukprot:COSAG02_NODE_3734_length_6311_cov_70.627173_4_plen_187_part_00